MLEPRPRKGITGRPRVVLIVFAVLICLIFFRLWSLQIVQVEKFRRLSIRNSIRTIVLKPRRGNIYDRHGRLLAGNRIRYDASVFFSRIFRSRDRKNVIQILHRVINLPVEEIESRIAPDRIIPFIPSKVSRDISAEQFYKLKMLEPEHPGLMCEIEPVRTYKHGSLLAHTLGYVGAIPFERWEKYRDNKTANYRKDDIVGLAGIERRFEEYLRGIKGSEKIIVDNRGRISEIIDEIKPQSGSDIVLSIDLDLQKKCEQVLRDKKGCVVAVDPNNGDVLAMASSPAFDPNLFTSTRTPEVVEKIKQLYAAGDNPLYNRAISFSYPMGSAFKVIVALAALELEDTAVRIGPETTFNCPGSFLPAGFKRRPWRCFRGRSHGALNLTQGIQKSCNVYFYNLGYRIGRDPICRMADKFGLGKKTGILLQGEISGINPSAENYPDRWYGGLTIQLSIGQFPLEVTPLQVAMAYAAIANGGTLYQPRLILEINSPVKKIANEPSGYKLDVGQESLNAVKEGLKLVTLPGGTAGTVFKGLEYLKAAGKTSTAEYGKARQFNHAWFICYAPHDEPRIVLVVLVEQGETGGKTAAPLARDILVDYFSPVLQEKEKTITANDE